MKSIVKLWIADKRAAASLIASVLVQMLYTAVNAAVLAVLGRLFDDVVYNGIVLMALCVINTALGVIASWLMHYASARNFGSGIDRYTAAIVGAEVGVYSKYTSSYVTTMREYCSNVTTAGQCMAQYVTNIATLVVNVAALAMFGGKGLALVIGIVYLLGAFVLRVTMVKMSKNDIAASAAVKQRNQTIDNIVTAYSEMRVFDMGNRYLHKEYDENAEIYKLGVVRQRCKGVLNMVFNTLDTVGMAIAIIYAAMAIQAGTITPATAITLVMYVWRLGEPIFSLLNLSESFLTVLTRGKEFVNFLNDIEDHQEVDGSLELSGFNDSISFEDVSFSYEKTDNVLSNISFRIQKGMRVGIVGKSGGGKSTLFKLMNRFYRPDNGSILIDGIDINKLTEKSLRQHVSAVLQDCTILPGTIAENIRFGSKASELELIEACKKADLMTLIESLPDGFDTDVGPRGLKLSGGQKQRIALARAFLRKSDILLLDEATSALDNNSETLVQNALASLDKQTTVVMIAHRLSTVRDCDLIMVVDNHHIAEAGSHAQLMARKGIYYSMQK